MQNSMGRVERPGSVMMCQNNVKGKDLHVGGPGGGGGGGGGGIPLANDPALHVACYPPGLKLA